MGVLDKIININKINNILTEIEETTIYFEEKELSNNITVLKLLAPTNKNYMVVFEQDNEIKTEFLNKCNSEIIDFILERTQPLSITNV